MACTESIHLSEATNTVLNRYNRVVGFNTYGIPYKCIYYSFLYVYLKLCVCICIVTFSFMMHVILKL